MNLPTIFLSTTSDDLKDCRDLLHRAFERAGCKVYTQAQSFSASAGTVLEMLRQHLDKSEYIIHLAGLVYGAEPEAPPFPADPGFKCSYTQFEYYYAHQQGKKVIAFVCAEGFPYLPFSRSGEADRCRGLQEAHRERVRDGWFTGTPLAGRPRTLNSTLKDRDELLLVVGGVLGTIHDLAPVGQLLLAEARLHQLPSIPPGFTGRTADLAALRGRRTAAITGLKGMGGIGKTALAIVLAHEWRGDFPDAQIFLNGFGTSDNPPTAARLLEQVLQAFHPEAKLPDDAEQLRALYLQTLAGRRVLILLDNAQDAAQAKPLLPPPSCGLIVTSRHSFVLGTVAAYRLGELPETEAVDLLRAFCPALSDADARVLARRCAYLPLALKLAGSHLAIDASDRGGVPDVAAYLTQLTSGRLRALDADAPDAGEVTISETLRVSESALPAELRDTWRTLSVFPAPFAPAAAEAIAGAGPEALQTLLRRSLLDAVGSRYRLHNLAAEYAREQLDAEALTRLRLAHANYYRTVLAECDRLYLSGSSGVTAGLALFDSERAQIEAAHAWLLGAPEGDQLLRERVEHLASYPDAGAYVLSLRRHPRERIVWLQAALAGARRLQDRRCESNALGNLGIAWSDLGDARKAIGFYEQHLAIARETGDRRDEGNALGNLGVAWTGLGEARKAIGFFEQHLVFTRETGDRRGEGADLGNLGVAWSALGDARKAIGLHEQRLAIDREIGDRRGEGGALNDLGIAWSDLGDARKAIGFYEQALGIFREIGDRRFEGNALGNLGVAWNHLGDVPKAIGFYEQRLTIARETGDRSGEGSALGNLGLAWGALGDARMAIKSHEQALMILREIGDRRGEGSVVGNLGVAWAALGEARKAIGLDEQHLAIAREIGDRGGEAIALFNSALSHEKLGEPVEALARAEQAAAIFAEIESPHAEKARQLVARLRTP